MLQGFKALEIRVSGVVQADLWPLGAEGGSQMEPRGCGETPPNTGILHVQGSLLGVTRCLGTCSLPELEGRRVASTTPAVPIKLSFS